MRAYKIFSDHVYMFVQVCFTTKSSTRVTHTYTDQVICMKTPLRKVTLLGALVAQNSGASMAVQTL